MKILQNVPLSQKTTLKLGGRASFFVSIASVGELGEAVSWSRERGLPYFILAGGSNTLFPDSGFDGVVIRIDIRGLWYEKRGDETFVTAGAGEEWDSFVSETVKKNLWGLENLSGIPGSVGATPVQNVGAYGAEVSDCVEWVNVYGVRTRKIKRIKKQGCQFAYRNSWFKGEKGKDFVIVSVCFRLSKKSAPSLSYLDLKDYFKRHKKEPSQDEIRNAVLTIRRRKFPDLSILGTAGSFFKNPIVESGKAGILKKHFPEMPMFLLPSGKTKVSLAWILDKQLHMKGIRQGNVGTFKRQPIVLVRYDGATSSELVAFSEKIQKLVADKVGIKIVPEVTIIKNKIQK